jgi:hypothetical protein
MADEAEQSRSAVAVVSHGWASRSFILIGECCVPCKRPNRTNSLSEQNCARNSRGDKFGGAIFVEGHGVVSLDRAELVSNIVSADSSSIDRASTAAAALYGLLACMHY